MRVKRIEGGKKPLEWAKFRISGINAAFANAVRRAILSEVKTLAIDEVGFIENSSGLYDEMLALRLGLVPIKTPDDMLTREECDCGGQGCHKCTVLFKLEKKGPGLVYSGDLKSDHDEAVPVFKEIPLTLLAENQSVNIECAAVLGKGKDHARFQCAFCTYNMKEFDKKNDQFFFRVESFGQRSVAKIVEEAGAVLEAKAKAFKKEL